MYAYDETCNLIEIRGRGVKISFSSVSFLTGAAMGAISVCTIRIYVTIMASFAAFVDI